VGHDTDIALIFYGNTFRHGKNLFYQR